MPILQMTISNLPDPVTADVTYNLLCQVIGAQPLPSITWTLDNTELPSDPVKISHGNNMTSSALVFTPQKAQNRQKSKRLKGYPTFLEQAFFLQKSRFTNFLRILEFNLDHCDPNFCRRKICGILLES